jgi:3-oxoadipate enol-lactonase
MTPAPLRRRGMAAVVDRRVDRSTARWAAEEWARHDPAALMQGGRALSRFDATSWTGEIDVPAAVVVTEHDTTVRPHRQTALAAAIPGALTVEVAAGHRACAEQADLFVPALIRGLEAVSHRTRQEAGTS